MPNYIDEIFHLVHAVQAIAPHTMPKRADDFRKAAQRAFAGTQPVPGDDAHAAIPLSLSDVTNNSTLAGGTRHDHTNASDNSSANAEDPPAPGNHATKPPSGIAQLPFCPHITSRIITSGDAGPKLIKRGFPAKRIDAILNALNKGQPNLHANASTGLAFLLAALGLPKPDETLLNRPINTSTEPVDFHTNLLRHLSDHNSRISTAVSSLPLNNTLAGRSECIPRVPKPTPTTLQLITLIFKPHEDDDATHNGTCFHRVALFNGLLFTFTKSCLFHLLGDPIYRYEDNTEHKAHNVANLFFRTSTTDRKAERRTFTHSETRYYWVTP